VTILQLETCQWVNKVGTQWESAVFFKLKA